MDEGTPPPPPPGPPPGSWGGGDDGWGDEGHGYGYDEDAPLERRRRPWVVAVAVVVVVAMLGGAVAAFIVMLTSEASPFASSEPFDPTEPPVANEDHWHAAYAVSICEGFEPAFTRQDDIVGIHSHGDGVIHIHPFVEAAAGRNATLAVFLEAVGASITDQQLLLDDGRRLTEGEDECDGRPGRLVVARWPDAALAADQAPELITDNLADVRFGGDREAYTIAFVPEGVVPRPPPSISHLSVLSDVAPESTPA